MLHSFGHDVPSDWGDKADDDPVFGIYKKCGFWTHDEAAILYNVAKLAGSGWLDVGCHTGWTTRHIRQASCLVKGVDPMLRVPEFRRRYFENLAETIIPLTAVTSAEYYARLASTRVHFSGHCIDGDHEPGKPLEDAQNAAKHLADTGVIIFHDALGLPVREAAQWLMGQGFKARWYSTPHGILLCWRGDFVPPDHVPDPNLPDLKARCPEFPFDRCA